MITAKILTTLAMIAVIIATAFIIGGSNTVAGAIICLIAGACITEIWKLKG
ncbi:hypothetical protein V1389_02050 [Flavobacterium rakeshii]|uniref:hypothetical protein n=1 Tax=Flavobacterium rakeshii TaxID=1038845 RepID=UPI002E7ACF1E|nr:hypothetical protein [Flavobacterium rakeshii]MEE1897099.1 hypothetical protein [Flavobacterium rakeshii]